MGTHHHHDFVYVIQHLDVYVSRWIEHGGYPILFLLLFSCGLGLPVPEDVPLLAAGWMVGIGKFNLALAAACAWCGIIGGDCVLYHLGKRYGLAVTKIPFIGRHLTMSRILWVEQRFKHYGVWVVAIGRLFAGVRGAMVVCAGAIRYPFGKFLVADGVAALFSGGLFLALGIYFGKQMERLRVQVDKGKHYAIVISLLAVLVTVAWIWVHQKLNRRNQPDTNQPDSATTSDGPQPGIAPPQSAPSVQPPNKLS